MWIIQTATWVSAKAERAATFATCLVYSEVATKPGSETKPYARNSPNERQVHSGAQQLAAVRVY